MKMSFFLFMVLLFSAASIECGPLPRATLDQGTVEGYAKLAWNGDTFYAFLGLPYAKPPINEHRFKAPEKPGSWKGIRDATKEGPACKTSFPEPNANVTYSEDCLYANVFTKQVPAINSNTLPLPVLVFLHGGSFVGGTTALNLYGPEYFMSKDVVLVTVNYRVGPFGFLSVDDDRLGVPGNAGLKDQRMALKWIKKNIAKFGGDPKRVTIFGEGAGAASVHYHILSSSSNGLFQRAVLESGTALNPWTRGRKNAILVAKILRKNVTTEAEALKCLMEATADQLADAARNVEDTLYDFVNIRPFGPVIEKPSDSAFITKEPTEILTSGDYNKVPIIIGFNNKEGYLAFNDTIPLKKDLRTSIPRTLGIKSDSPKVNELISGIQEIYLKDGMNGVYDVLTNLLIFNGASEAAKIHCKSPEVPVYFYKVTAETNLKWNRFTVPLRGVPNRQVLAYQFKQWALPPPSRFSKEGKLIEHFTTLWANFAATGNPTPENQAGIRWKRVSSPDSLDYLEFGDQLTMKVNPLQERVTFRRGYQGQHCDKCKS